MSGNLRGYLEQGAEHIGLNLTDKQIDSFNIYYNLLIESNKNINLTSIVTEKEVALKHFIDSLTCLKAMDFKKETALIDVGTGAGFPGLPIKIFRPDLKIVLLDSLEKRVNFLKSVIKELRLTGIEALHGRAEDAAREKNLRERFDFSLSRAVASIPVLAEYCLPFVTLNGFFISQKGPGVDDELKSSANALKILGGSMTNILKLNLPVINDERRIVVIQKTGSTPQQYPRRAGIPAKKPL